MEYKQIQELIKTINKSSISELSIEEGDFKIVIKQEITLQAPYAMAPAPQVQVAMAPQQPIAAQPVAAAAPAAPAAAPAAPAAAPATNQVTIKSPMIGTFYRSSGPGKPTFVN